MRSPRPVPRPMRSQHSSTGGCCASRRGSTCAASSSRTTCCAASCARAGTCAGSARRATPRSANSPSSANASGRRAGHSSVRARSRPCAGCSRSARSPARSSATSACTARSAPRRSRSRRARGEAEKLIVYLLDDFYRELEPVGRLDIVAALAKQAVDYYAGLPAELRTDDTDRNRALALVRYGAALRNQARLDESSTAIADAIAVLEKLRSKGDRSETTTIGLGLG